MSDLTYFKVYLDTKPILEDLTLEEVGKIFLAMYDFAETGKEPNFSKGTVLKVAGASMIATIDRAKRKYKKRLSPEERSKINSENGKKGGAPKGNQNARKKNDTDQKPDQEPEKPDLYTAGTIMRMENSLERIDSGLMKLLSSQEAVEFITLFMMYYEDDVKEPPFDIVFSKKNNIGAYTFRDMVKANNFTKFIKTLKKEAKKLWTDEPHTTVDEYQDSYFNTKSKVKYALEYLLDKEKI